MLLFLIAPFGLIEAIHLPSLALPYFRAARTCAGAQAAWSRGPGANGVVEGGTRPRPAGPEAPLAAHRPQGRGPRTPRSSFTSHLSSTHHPAPAAPHVDPRKDQPTVSEETKELDKDRWRPCVPWT